MKLHIFNQFNVLIILNEVTMVFNDYSDDLVYDVIRQIRENKFIDLFEGIGYHYKFSEVFLILSWF